LWVSKLPKPKVQIAYRVALTFEGGGVVAQAFLSLSLSSKCESAQNKDHGSHHFISHNWI
jgi:hypothetical protein